MATSDPLGSSDRPLENPGGGGLAGPAAPPAAPPHDHALAGRAASARRRRWRLPLILFACTCVSVFFVGGTRWFPLHYLQLSVDPQAAPTMPLRRVLLNHWQDGLIYTACMLGILLTHEMGHYLTSRYYKIPATLPYFLPLPFNPIGTMGAVIAMFGSKANRRQMFDIGLAGPLAGLALAIPIMWIGVRRLDFHQPLEGGVILDLPLLTRLMLAAARPEGFAAGDQVWLSQVNPYFMAGWVGLLITGLNMWPVGQLDGGHVVYTLLGPEWGRRAARLFMLAAIVFMFVAQTYMWWLMLVLVMFMGVEHPPTADDKVPLGWPRATLGVCALSIPLLCFPPWGMYFV